MPSTRPPFAERGGSVRGVIDLATGCYPSFLFGGSMAGHLPVFHLHESDPGILRSRLAYLADNGYRTVTTDAIVRLVVDGVHPGPRSVALCFDDCWATLWTVAAPLLRAHGMRAIAFAIPDRIADADAVRPTIEDDHSAAAAVDRSHTPFATWPELQRLHLDGLVDVQSHTRSHSAIYSSHEIAGFVTPDYVHTPLLDRPLLDRGRWATPDDLGLPLYVQRSRMSDARRYLDDPDVRDRCVAHVERSGRGSFFTRPGWQAELRRLAASKKGSFEPLDDAVRAVEAELADAREMLGSRLGTAVRHVCLPWGIGGRRTRAALARTGHQLAFADRLFGRRSVAAGDDPYSLMRLHERFISCLPGRGRRMFFTAT